MNWLKLALRWLLILPAAAVGVVLSQFPVHWFLVFLRTGFLPQIGPDPTSFLGMSMEMVEFTAINFTNPVVAILVVRALAPAHKRLAALGLAGTWALGISALFAFYEASGWSVMPASYVVGSFVKLAASYAGVATGLALARRAELAEKRRLPLPSTGEDEPGPAPVPER